MTVEVDSLERRLARWRAAHGTTPSTVEPTAHKGTRRSVAARLAAELDGEVVGSRLGTIVRLESEASALSVDRGRLAEIPSQPGATVPLLCLDTETTGLGTAAGTVAFLVGLGWWEADAFRQVQLLLPDQADEPALLEAVRAAIPAGGWLVTYNGRGFDWPLLETRFRLRRWTPPVLDGHLDLLPFVRRVFRHRLPDARLRSVERHILGMDRIGDVEGWQIPGRYLEVLRGGSPLLLRDVIHHNALDVRSLGMLLGYMASTLADANDPSGADPGDLAGVARLLRRSGRPEAALGYVDAALARWDDRPPRAPLAPEEPWWSPRRAADIGGPSRSRPVRTVVPWTLERLAAERARLLRALDRPADAVEAWRTVAAAGGRRGALAWVEIAKLREHAMGDPVGALEATMRARAGLERARALGRPEPHLDASIARRIARLRRRVARGTTGASTRGTGRAAGPGAVRA
jgi:uncharacterized protein YprB with RNaseH-like and TPR domain